MTFKRGTRLDKLPNGNYRLILFGHFSHGPASQEINDIGRDDLFDILAKITAELSHKEDKDADSNSKNAGQ